MVATNGAAPTCTEVEGVVGRVNEKGFTLAGHDNWFNWSKWATSPVLPDAGDHILATLDRSGYVRAITVLSSTAESSEPNLTVKLASEASEPGRETQIRRMNVLTTATAILSSRGAVDVAEVLHIAGVLEGWILR